MVAPLRAYPVECARSAQKGALDMGQRQWTGGFVLLGLALMPAVATTAFADEQLQPPPPTVHHQPYKPRVFQPGPNPDSTSGGRYGTDTDWNPVAGTRNPLGGEAWTGYPAAHPDKAHPRGEITVGGAAPEG